MPEEVIPDTPDTVRDIQDFLSHMHEFSVIWPHKCLNGCRACYLIERIASLTTQLQQATLSSGLPVLWNS